MATGSRSRRNAPPRSAEHGDLDELEDPEERTPAPARYTKEDLQTMTMFFMDLFLQAQASRPKSEGPREVQGSFCYRRRHWHQPY